MEMVHFIPAGQRRLAMLAAQADSAPALISGSSGTGKGAISRWIHNNGPRAARVFVEASKEKPFVSQVAQAQGGTLVIPEIGEWSLTEQKAIVGFLKTRAVPHPQSNGTPMLLNVRIIATTSQALDGRAQGGLFNADLLSKLNVFRIEMPPLARRTEEFEDIVLGIMAEIARDLHKEYLRSLSPEAWSALRGYEWPGNIRELRNVLRIAIVSAKGDRIEASDLPEFGHHRIDFRATREQFEKIYILELLRTFNWEIDKTCRMTHMDKNTLLSKMRQYQIETDPQSPRPTDLSS